MEPKSWVTDFIYGKNTYRLDQVIEVPGIPVLHNLLDVPDMAFVLEELMHISDDPKVSPVWVSTWK